MKNKVLIFADPDSIHTKKWFDGWKLLGYDSDISGLSPETFDNKLVFSANINVEGGNSREFFKNIFNFKKVLKNVNPNIINAHYLTSYGLIASLIKRKNDKLVIILPGTDVMQTMDKNYIYLIMAKFIFYRSDLLVSVSDTMTKKILKYFPYLEDKIITQQYGIDIDFFDKFETDSKNIDLLTNRGWVKNSNYEILLDVFNKFDNISKAMVGYNESDYSSNLKSKYPALDESIYKALPYDKSISLVARCKIFISLTTSDGTPLSLLEAMYLGAIPIVSDLKTNHEVIEHGINGFIVPIDKQKLEETINHVLSLSDEEIKKIRVLNKELINKRFNMEKNFKKMDRLLK